MAFKASTPDAQSVTSCPKSDICYRLSIPSRTTSTGSGDIYFQIAASTRYQWVALGQGTGMTGSNMFVMYTDASGSNTTVSPRFGTGHVEPQHDTSTTISVLEGSGVSNGTMVANVRCSNCATWQGGAMNFSSRSTSWIQAYKYGSALNTNDLGASISQHDGEGVFDWDISQAKGGSSSNPFIEVNGTPSLPPLQTGGSSGPSSDSGNDQTTSGHSNAFLYAHAALACIVFVALLPGGAILVRLSIFGGNIWIHAMIQIFSFMMYMVAVGLGIYMAVPQGIVDKYHPIIGLILLGLLFFQPFLGWQHHASFCKYQRRSIWSYIHLTIGRTAILLGMVNGGLGLLLTGSDVGSYAAYGVCAGFVGIVYVGAATWGECRRAQNAKQRELGIARTQSGEVFENEK
ncbi:hypothetical protein M433DRAFT_104559 [Acidomyces richmondensis BFW]|nr:hypothetical protein M433DRAFT_104559 [Acidomyces richmondensis BFW]